MTKRKEKPKTLNISIDLVKAHTLHGYIKGMISGVREGVDVDKVKLALIKLEDQYADLIQQPKQKELPSENN